MKKQNRALTLKTNGGYDVSSLPTAGAVVNPPSAGSRPPFSPLPKIPLYATDGSLIGHFDQDWLRSVRGVDLVKNRRGYIKRALLKVLTCHVVDISHGWEGACFEQHLPAGFRIYALKGVRGSK